MSMDWFRWHHGTVNDPKWRVIARKSNANVRDVLAVFAVFLERASQAEPRGSIAGWDADDIGAGLDMDAEAVTAVHSAMQGKVLDGDSLTGWEKRQPKREREETSTDRVRKHRESQKPAVSNDGVTVGVTPCNANETHVTPRNANETHETPRLDKIREEKKDSVANATGDKSPTEASPISAADAIFRQGLAYLKACNIGDAQARSLLGKWRKDAGDGRVIELLTTAQVSAVSDIVPWMGKAIRQQPRRGAPATPGFTPEGKPLLGRMNF